MALQLLLQGTHNLAATNGLDGPYVWIRSVCMSHGVITCMFISCAAEKATSVLELSQTRSGSELQQSTSYL
jgi:hypothetical protein